MQAIMMGNIADVVCMEIEKSIPYLELNILKGVVGQILPKHGIVIQSSVDELRDNEGLGKCLYHDVEIKVKG